MCVTQEQCRNQNSKECVGYVITACIDTQNQYTFVIETNVNFDSAQGFGVDRSILIIFQMYIVNSYLDQPCTLTDFVNKFLTAT